jgi:hypothetical protein
MTKNLITLLSPGHGGVGPFNTYLTRWKRSFEVPPGVYEGGFNEEIVEEVERQILHCGNTFELPGGPGTPTMVIPDSDISTVNLRPGPVNTPLRSRIKYSNALKRALPDHKFLYLACHANAARGKGWSKARGHKIFYKAGNADSKRLARMIDFALTYAWPGVPSRGIKAAPWLRECRGPRMPAVLVEFGFMTNREDCEYLSDREKIERAGEAVALTIEEWSKTL